MSDYTPTTDTVQATYAVHHSTCAPCGETVSLVAEFDRWLTAHDREVAARTRRELRGLMAAAYTAGYRDQREERGYDPGGDWGTSEYSGLGRVIWEASRQDEGTISALGADVVAKAVLGSDWLAAHDREVAARTLREAAGLFADELGSTGVSLLLGHADGIEKGELNV